jgi:hypothetical protein
MYGYSLSSSIRRRASVCSLISFIGAKPVSLLQCYGRFGQLSAAPRLEEAKPFSTDTPRVAHGKILLYFSSFGLMGNLFFMSENVDLLIPSHVGFVWVYALFGY